MENGLENKIKITWFFGGILEKKMRKRETSGTGSDSFDEGEGTETAVRLSDSRKMSKRNPPAVSDGGKVIF